MSKFRPFECSKLFVISEFQLEIHCLFCKIIHLMVDLLVFIFSKHDWNRTIRSDFSNILWSTNSHTGKKCFYFFPSVFNCLFCKEKSVYKQSSVLLRGNIVYITALKKPCCVVTRWFMPITSKDMMVYLVAFAASTFWAPAFSHSFAITSNTQSQQLSS